MLARHRWTHWVTLKFNRAWPDEEAVRALGRFAYYVAQALFERATFRPEIGTRPLFFVAFLEWTKKGYPHWHVLFELHGPPFERVEQVMKRKWRFVPSGGVHIRPVGLSQMDYSKVSEYATKCLSADRAWNYLRVSTDFDLPKYAVEPVVSMSLPGSHGAAADVGAIAHTNFVADVERPQSRGPPARSLSSAQAPLAVPSHPNIPQHICEQFSMNDSTNHSAPLGPTSASENFHADDATMNVMKPFERHPLSEIFGEWDPGEFARLKENMATHGFDERHPIVLFEGKVLDGWHRQCAARDLGIIAPTTNFQGTLDEARALVERENDVRRHMPTARRIMVIGKLNAWLPPGNPAQTGNTAGLTEAEIARRSGASERSVRDVRVVMERGSPEIQKAMSEQSISIAKAADIVRREVPKRWQLAAVAAASVEPVQSRPKRKPVADDALPRYEDLAKENGELREENVILREKHQILIDEVDRLQDRLAIVAMDAATEEERALAEQTLTELRNENRALHAKMEAIVAMRDGINAELNELKRQCLMYKATLRRIRRADSSR